jgi:alkylhydroperoxidase family enzyme
MSEAAGIEGPTRPRIDPVELDDPRLQLNIFRTLANNRDLSRAFRRLGAHLLTDGRLPARERELVILRVGWRCGSEYEFGQHRVIGAAAGLTDEEIARVAECGEGEWDLDDGHLMTFVDELCSQDCVSQATWDALRRRWDDADLLEMLVLAGYYRLVSGMLTSVGVALEATTPGWPEGANALRHAPRDRPA